MTNYFLTDGSDYRFVVGYRDLHDAALSVLGEGWSAITLWDSHSPAVDRRQSARQTRSHGGLLEQVDLAATLE